MRSLKVSTKLNIIGFILSLLNKIKMLTYFSTYVVNRFEVVKKQFIKSILDFAYTPSVYIIQT